MKTAAGRGHILREGDWLKLGRVRLRVKKILIKNSLPPGSQNDTQDIPKYLEALHTEVKSIDSIEDVSKSENLACRICLFDTFVKEDPLISPCKCAGTMKQVHLNCLKE